MIPKTCCLKKKMMMMMEKKGIHGRRPKVIIYIHPPVSPVPLSTIHREAQGIS